MNLESGRAALDAFPAYAMRYAIAVWESVERLSAERGPFDLIEFPDYHAEGYFAIRAKRTLGRFDRSTLAVRLHSASWICMEADHEPRLKITSLIRAHAVVSSEPSPATSTPT